MLNAPLVFYGRVLSIKSECLSWGFDACTNEQVKNRYAAE